ncbi:MAG: hypothetical protein Q8N59_03170 [bacterium]|nr:hypothetical protein [bacterium]
MRKYYLKTFGCQINESDSQRIASFLEKRGYDSIKGADSSDEALAKADLIVVNACSVRQTAIDRIWGLLNKIKKLKVKNPNLKIIITGCLLETDKKKFKGFLALHRTCSGAGFNEVMDIQKFLGKNYLHLKPKCPQNKSAYLPIMTGCDNFCSYCVVPYTRGKEISRPLKEVIKEFGELLKNGHT